MQCGVFCAHLQLNLPSHSRMVRQGRLALRSELDSGDDALAHGKRETGANMAHAAHRGVVAQLKVDFGAVELPSVVVQSLRNIQAARKEFLPLTANLSTAVALAFQIKLREISLTEILAIRGRLRLRNSSSDGIAWQAPFQRT